MSVPAAQPCQAHKLQQLIRPTAAFRFSDLSNLEAELDILGHAHVAEYRIVLKDEPRPALLWREVRYVAPA